MNEYEILESTPDAMFVASSDGHILFVNVLIEYLFGYSRAELIGVPVETLVPDRFRSLHSSHRDRYCAGARTRPMGSGLDVYARRKDGTEFPAEISLSPVPLRDDLRIIGVVRDITERKRVEEELREGETRYRSLVHGATYGIYRATFDGQFVDVNPALLRMLGYEDEAELLAKNASEVYENPKDRARLIARYRADQIVTGVETRWKRRDGSPFTVKLSGRVLHDSAGAAAGFEMIVEDVSERRLLEERLRMAEKLEAIGRLTAGVAHHFNNLLAVMIGRMDVVRFQLERDSPAAADLAAALQAGREASALVKRMEEFGQQTEGRPVALDLNRTLADLLPLLKSAATDRVEVILNRALRLPTVSMDRAHVEGIMISLVLNGRDAMPEGGTLTITTGFDARSNRVRVTAQDTGVGMDEATRSRVFDPFFTTDFGRGTGLGLSAVYGLVTRSGGTIRAKSERGVGTTFTIEWPPADDAS